MRSAAFLLTLLLWIPASLDAQAKKTQRDLEQFDVSGLPAQPTTDAERQIFLLLRAHRRGDLEDATRIHMLLAQYYKEQGDAARASECSRLAAEAWKAKDRPPPTTAAAAGKPPFAPEGTFRRTFAYTDELNVAHTWEFFADGTFNHIVSEVARGVRDGRHDGRTRRPSTTSSAK